MQGRVGFVKVSTRAIHNIKTALPQKGLQTLQAGGEWNLQAPGR